MEPSVGHELTRGSLAEVNLITLAPSRVLPPRMANHRLTCCTEGGGRARDMPNAWAAAFRGLCALAGMCFFMRQIARKPPIPDRLLMRQFQAAA